MATVAEHVPFRDICNLCEKISRKKGRDKKMFLQHFTEKWRKFHKELHENDPDTTDSFFPALRLLLPQCERQRAAYGIKETTLAKLYIEILCLSKESTDAQKLLNYRSPKSAKGDAGDFASVAYFILNKRCPTKGSLKIHDVNVHLDNIADSNSNKNKTEVRNSLLHLLRNTTALEQKWLIRMILKNMALGISEQTVLSAFHLDAKDLYNVTNSLEKVCSKLKDPMVRLHEIEIELFTPFRPMLAEQAQPQKVMELMNNQPFIIETKYDGERVQLHRLKSMFKYFSRGGHECTSVYGGSRMGGSLTPYIADCFMPNIDSCILDGEMVVYSTKLNCIVSKGENAEVKFAEPDGDYGPCFCVFDILMLNSKVLTNLPFGERTNYLNDVFAPKESKIRLTERKEAVSREDVDIALNDAITRREEGIIVKNVLSVYRHNVRAGGGWLKIKPDYITGLMNELDLLIIGGYFGEGRRANMISHFLLAVAVPCNNSGSHPQRFLSITKVGSGYTMKELNDLLQDLAPNWEVLDTKNHPQCIEFGSGRKYIPDVWIDPSKSRIVQIKASEIVRSNHFPVYCTLRFPRVEKIRYDKPWYNCMTTTELETLRKEAEGRLATCNYSTLPDEPSPKKRIVVRQEQVVSIAPHFRPTDVSGVQQESEILIGKEFCVISSSPQGKQLLEREIVQYGGRFVQNPGPETHCVLADKLTVKVKNIMSTKYYNVVKTDWLHSCVKEGKLLSWVPEDMLYTTPQTLEKFSEDFDKYGDSFFDDATGESLSTIFKNISPSEWQSHCVTKDDIALLERKYFPNSSSFGLFRTCRVYLDGALYTGSEITQVEDYKMKLISMKVRLYGGSVCEEINDKVTHVIMHSNNAKRFQELLDISEKTKKFYIVSTMWVDKCVASNRLLTEKKFKPV